MPKDLRDEWNKQCQWLVGKTIEEVRYLLDEEMQDLGWHQSSLVIVFSDGSYIFASADDEGNGPGALFTSNDAVPTIPVI